MKLAKSHHHRKQKNRSFSRGFRTRSWFAFVAHWYWRSFSSSGKKNKQKTKTEMNLNPLRDEWLNAAEDFMYREDGIWFSRRQDLWDKIRSLLSFHSLDLKRHFPPTIFITLRLILEYISEHMDTRYSHSSLRCCNRLPAPKYRPCFRNPSISPDTLYVRQWNAQPEFLRLRSTSTFFSQNEV